MELYSLKFEIDFGVITDRGVFIDEIFAKSTHEVSKLETPTTQAEVERAPTGSESSNFSRLKLDVVYQLYNIIRYEPLSQTLSGADGQII